MNFVSFNDDDDDDDGGGSIGGDKVRGKAEMLCLFFMFCKEDQKISGTFTLNSQIFTQNSLTFNFFACTHRKNSKPKHYQQQSGLDALFTLIPKYT